MTTGVAFLKWTEQGVKNYRDTLDRYEQATKTAGEHGVQFKDIYWTPGGPYDIVCVMEAGEEKELASFILSMESMGNLRGTWCDAYGPDQMREIIQANR
ncbi:GYD domain-containing protein [Spirillospora sp. CA-128828]|uniref:GYD domain-containing protein n=1 Tax=Spirillospora sp. CA-128828 TaxID=3240033 RepID=UPI003D928AB5